MYMHIHIYYNQFVLFPMHVLCHFLPYATEVAQRVMDTVFQRGQKSQERAWSRGCIASERVLALYSENKNI